MKGNHDDIECKARREYRRKYEDVYGIWLDPLDRKKLPSCQFRGNKSKIQNLIRKVHIDTDGSVTEVQFANETIFDQ